jgi:hypothetical protein
VASKFTSTNPDSTILPDFIESHEQEKQIKDLVVQARVLDFEDLLYPQNYVMESNRTEEVVTWYRKLRTRRVGADSE